MTARLPFTWTTVTVDCYDAEALGAFYSELFGWDITRRDGSGWLQLGNPQGGISLNIQADSTYEPPVWPEQPGRPAKMIHFEVLVDNIDSAVEVVLAAGGTETENQPADRDPDRLRVMLDPAGHPFCLFVDGE